LYGSLWVSGYKYSKCDVTETIPKHLYILSEGKIKAGDIIFWSMHNKGFIGVAGVDAIYDEDTKKVIATTDKYMVEKSKGLGVYDKEWNKPKIKLIPYSFFPEFVDAWNNGLICNWVKGLISLVFV
jgi:hypothetical protein